MNRRNALAMAIGAVLAPAALLDEPPLPVIYGTRRRVRVDYVFREWADEFSRQLAATGLTPGADTGQINWPVIDVQANGYRIEYFDGA